jgi:hypothetical protein
MSEPNRQVRARKMLHVAKACFSLSLLMDEDDEVRSWNDLPADEKAQFVALAHGLIVLWKALNS